MRQKGFAPIIIIVLIILGIAGYFGYKQFKPTIDNSSGSSSPTTDPTANWKVYTNPIWGYSFKYPSQWGISTIDNDIVELVSDPGYITAMENWDNSAQGPFKYSSNNYGLISFSIYKKGSNTAAGVVTDQTDIKDFVQKMFGLTYTSVTDITLNGQPAVAFISDEMIEKPGLPPGMQDCPPKDAPCTIPSGRKIKQVWTKINGSLLYMVYSQGGTYTDIDKLPALFDQILSTFKFTSASP